jgi:hypothetical protein
MFLKKFDLRRIIDKAFETGAIKLWLLDGL